MHPGVAKPGDRIQMRVRRVTLVPIKTVPRVFLVKLTHLSVSCDLRQNRCSGDRRASTVALHDMTLWNKEIRKGKPIHQHEVGQRDEPTHGLTHGVERCLVDVQPINIIRTRDGQRPSFGTRDYLIMKPVSRRGCQQFRVTHARNRTVRVEHDCCGDNRTGKAAAPDLIYTSHAGKPEPPDSVLNRASR